MLYISAFVFVLGDLTNGMESFRIPLLGDSKQLSSPCDVPALRKLLLDTSRSASVPVSTTCGRGLANTWCTKRQLVSADNTTHCRQSSTTKCSRQLSKQLRNGGILHVLPGTRSREGSASTDITTDQCWQSESTTYQRTIDSSAKRFRFNSPDTSSVCSGVTSPVAERDSSVHSRQTLNDVDVKPCAVTLPTRDVGTQCVTADDPWRWCGHCDIGFHDDVMYSIHMGCHSVSEPFTCNVCGQKCRHKYEFYTHIIRGHRVFEVAYNEER